AVGDGGQPGSLRRLPLPDHLPGSGHHPGKRRGGPGVPDHLAAFARLGPAHPEYVHAGGAQHGGRDRRRTACYGGRRQRGRRSARPHLAPAPSALAGRRLRKARGLPRDYRGRPGTGDRPRGGDDTLTVMSDDGTSWRERTTGARMNGDGSEAPPWGPADPVPDLKDTQAIPGLGSIRGPGGTGDQAGDGPAAEDTRDSGNRDGGTDADAETGEDAADAEGGKHRRSFWRELPVLIVIALVLALVIKAFAIQAFYIPSSSMENTLDIGDRVLINKIVYHLRPIHRGDIVVFDGAGSCDVDAPAGRSNIFSKAVDELEGLVGSSHDASIYIKRVIGVPGDPVA